LRVITLGGWYGSGNVGDDAILIGLRDLFAEVAPNVEIVALSTDPAQTRGICGVESLLLQNPLGYLSYGYGATFRGADAVVVTGGTPFYDWDHVSRLIHMGLARGGVPLACFGVGAKRIDSPHGRLLTRLILSGALRVSARDAFSRTRLGEISGRQVALTGDSALWVEPAPKCEIDTLCKALGFESGEEYVVICPRALSPLNRAHYHDSVSAALIASIRENIAALADELTTAGYNTVFLPMHCAKADDDAREIKVIEVQMKTTAVTILRPLHPRITAAFLGSASLVVGLRLHSLILAAAQGVPIVGVGYDEKIRGFMEYAGVPDCVVEPTDLRGKAFDVLGEVGLGGVLSDSCTLMRARVREEAEALVKSLGLG
jgi:polysaccharide pyruvyl transferase WcaK-like protein